MALWGWGKDDFQQPVGRPDPCGLEQLRLGCLRVLVCKVEFAVPVSWRRCFLVAAILRSPLPQLPSWLLWPALFRCGRWVWGWRPVGGRCRGHPRERSVGPPHLCKTTGECGWEGLEGPSPTPMPCTTPTPTLLTCFFLLLPERPAPTLFLLGPRVGGWGLWGGECCGERTLGSQGPRESLGGYRVGGLGPKIPPTSWASAPPFPVIFCFVCLIHFGFSPNHLVPGRYFWFSTFLCPSLPLPQTHWLILLL